MAVRTRAGDEISATKVIIANVTVRNLFTRLLSPPNDLDSRFS